MGTNPSADRVTAHVESMRDMVAKGQEPRAYAIGVIDGLANPHTAAPLPDTETLRRIREVLRALDEVTR